MKKILITYIMIFVIISTLPYSETEVLPQVYSDSRQFDYMDLCNIYPIFNISDSLQMTERELGVNSNQIVTYEELMSGNKLKPHKTLYLNDSFNEKSILLFSQVVYNWTNADKFIFEVYYEDLENSSLNIELFYNDYITTSGSDNITDDYYYIDGDLNNYTSSTQSVFQRSSNIHPLEPVNTLFNSYDAQYGLNNVKTAITVRNTTVIKTEKIKTNEWETITLNPTSFFNNDEVLNSNEFINIGISRFHQNHTLIIRNMIIQKSKTYDIDTNYPFQELYVFNNLTETSKDASIFEFDMVSQNYQTLTITNVSLSTSYSSSSSGQLVLMVDNSTVWTSSVALRENDIGFIGYQFYAQRTLEGYYDFYIYWKWGSNTIDFSKVLDTNFSLQTIKIRSEKFAYLCNFEFYDFIDKSDIQIGYVRSFLKWDVIDQAIVRVDVNYNQEVTLVSDVNTGGLRIPGVKEIKNAISSALKPLFNTLSNFQNALLKPINSIIDQLTTLTSGLNSIISSFSTLLALIPSEFTDLISDMQAEFNALTNAMNSGFSTISAYVDGLESLMSAANSLLTIIKDDIGTVLTELSDILVDLGTIISSLTDIFDQIEAIFNTIEDFFLAIADFIDLMILFTDAFMTDLGAYIIDIISWFTEWISIVTDTLSVAFGLIALFFIYSIILGAYKYNETGNLEDLMGIANVFYQIALFIFEIAKVIINFIGGIIP